MENQKDKFDYWQEEELEQSFEFEKLIRKSKHASLRQKRSGAVEYLSFKGLESTGIVNHLFTTRKGGVSTGIYESMNLSYARGDDSKAVDENFRRIAAVFGSAIDRIVCSDQTHTTNIRRVTETDAGKGIVIKKDYSDVDGLITNVPGLILATFYADCVPLYFVDVENRAIGLSHSGWRGTVNRMGAATLKAMKEAFGTRPENVWAAIGPSICQDCYEVGSDVAGQFEDAFSGCQGEILKKGKAEGKYQLDLWAANQIILLEAGIWPEHLETTDICTCCNSNYLFSHRASHGKRGNLGAFLELKKQPAERRKKHG